MANYQSLIPGDFKGVYKVVKVTTYDEYQKVYVRVNSTKAFFVSKELKYSSGDILKIKGRLIEQTKEHFPYGFDYQEYLKFQNVRGKILISDVELVGRTFGINIIHENLNAYIMNNYNKPDNTILAALIIGEKNNLNNELVKEIQTIGIGHLFVISGLHMEIISSGLEKLLKKIKIKETYKSILILGVLIFYFIITSFMVSILRVIIGYLFSKVLSNKLKDLNAIDKICLNAIIVLLINPYYLFSFSFLLSYIIVIGIITLESVLKKGQGIKNFIINNLIISTSSTLISMPIVLKINPEINILSIIFNLFFIPFVSYIVLPFSFFIIVVPHLKIIYHYIIVIFLFLTNLCSKVSIVKFSFSHISVIFISIYYIIYFLIISSNKKVKKTKLIFCFVILILFWQISPSLSIKDNIYFLDVPIGDATLIQMHNKNTNILIDTGDDKTNELSNFLIQKGVRKLDAVIITHGDNDHIGGLKNIINKVKIKKLYLSYYDDISKKIISKYHLPSTKIIYIKGKDKIKINSLTFHVLWPLSKQNDINDNSLVLYSKIFNLKFLFTGDIEKHSEEELIKYYPSLKVDILKVAHHGSNTSSTPSFLDSISCKIAIAMNGYKNTFGFPSKLVTKRFLERNIILYNTIDYGTIYLTKSIINNKVIIKSTFRKNFQFKISFT